jgi:hypothetical protein
MARQTRRYEMTLLREMVSSEQCKEIHLSGNDGVRDQHAPLTTHPWWWDVLSFAHPDAVVFYEGRPRMARLAAPVSQSSLALAV